MARTSSRTKYTQSVRFLQFVHTNSRESGARRSHSEGDKGTVTGGAVDQRTAQELYRRFATG